jgi:hypothetical protein
MTPEITERDTSPELTGGDLQLPPVIEEAGEEARRKFLEFFTAQIASENTRKAYGRAAIRFFNWCEERGLSLEDVSPNVAAVYVRSHDGADATVKQHLAAHSDSRTTKLHDRRDQRIEQGEIERVRI